MIILIGSITGFLHSEIKYDIQDIGTLQTRSSRAIAINQQGQILGWYNVDGSNKGKRFFLRERTGDFHELPLNETGQTQEINWRFLTDEGKVYGTFDGNANFAVLYLWDRHNGVTKLGNLPGKEISAINNLGQVLIKSITETENGRKIIRPVIWHNGVVTKLKGLEGDVGIESEESYGLDMNNRGEVVGSSVAYLSYKNDIYKQTHAVKWSRGQVFDLHHQVPKSLSTSASTINDLGDVIISSYLLRSDGEMKSNYHYANSDATNSNYFLNEDGHFVDRQGKTFGVRAVVNSELYNNYDSIWMYLDKTLSMNDNGEIIAQGMTIYGENHIMFLVPIKS
jgi:uncharacterized membrane protein